MQKEEGPPRGDECPPLPELQDEEGDAPKSPVVNPAGAVSSPRVSPSSPSPRIERGHREEVEKKQKRTGEGREREKDQDDEEAQEEGRSRKSRRRR